MLQDDSCGQRVTEIVDNRWIFCADMPGQTIKCIRWPSEFWSLVRGSGTDGSEVDIESKDPQSLNEAVVVPRGSSMSDASNSPQAHMRVHIHGSWAWIMR